MRTTTTLLASAMALATLVIASAASATIVPVTLTGTTENINDVTGVFGTPGAKITNQAFTETFMINTDVGVFGSGTSTSAAYNSIFDPAAGPYAVSASLTIDGQTFAIQGDDFSSANVTPGSSTMATDYQLSSQDKMAGYTEEQYNREFTLELDGSDLPTTLTQALQLSGTASDMAGTLEQLNTSTGAVQVRDSFIDGVESPTDSSTVVSAIGDLYPTTVTFGTPVSAAPEPSTWLLMFVGLGGIGSMLRRPRTALGFRFKNVLNA